EVPATGEFVEVHRKLPPELGAKAGRGYYCVIFADHNVELEAVSLVPLSDELPPPAPEPWIPDEAGVATPAGSQAPARSGDSQGPVAPAPMREAPPNGP
ncbi:MAG TPA: hypothetical protein VFU02_07520, partial [Polyangiaceae bacterium]|nr:hypothetical protein [Polyangiaceae bacterium]